MELPTRSCHSVSASIVPSRAGNHVFISSDKTTVGPHLELCTLARWPFNINKDLFTTASTFSNNPRRWILGIFVTLSGANFHDQTNSIKMIQSFPAERTLTTLPTNLEVSNYDSWNFEQQKPTIKDWLYAMQLPTREWNRWKVDVLET